MPGHFTHWCFLFSQVPSSVEATVVLRSKELHEVFKTMGMLSLTIGKYSVLSDEEDVEENSEDALYMNSRRVVSD